MCCPIPVMNKPIHDDKCCWVVDSWKYEDDYPVYKIYRTECNCKSENWLNIKLSGEICFCGKPIKILTDER